MTGAIDGACRREEAPLAEGIVICDVIGCSLHQGRLRVSTGKALSPAVCVDLETHSVKVENGDVYILVPDRARPDASKGPSK